MIGRPAFCNSHFTECTQWLRGVCLLFGLLAASAGWSCLAAPPVDAATAFEMEIRPFLVARCVPCHGPNKQNGGLRLDSKQAILKGGDSGPAITPGDAEASLLWQRISAAEMPPEPEPKLEPQKLAAVRTWLQAGAAMLETSTAGAIADWQRHWAFLPVERDLALAALPEHVRQQLPPSGSLHPVDAFIDARLAELQLSKAPPASWETLVRRAYFDLIGLPPTPAQIDAFLKEPSPQAWAGLLSDLLNSPQYGERYGRHWLDVARYADSGGYETDMYYRNAWRYRDYVVKSFNADKPYDRFVQEQIAGDEIWPNDLELGGSYVMPADKIAALEAHTGTGFYALGPQIHESSMDARKQDYERLTDWVDATGSAFMGLTLGCARCHNHKFDPFTQQDYYALQAVFAQSKEGLRELTNAMEQADYKQHYPRVLAVRAAKDAYRRFEAGLAGRQPTPEEEAKRSALLQALGQAVLEVPERATSTPNSFWDGIFEPPSVSVLVHERPELVKPVYRLDRGELDLAEEQISPAIPLTLALATRTEAQLPPGTQTRKQLALWLTRPDHPLTARVIVNRVWQWHFGRGLVATASDFGQLGQRPTHPQLLDWLTSEFIAGGWSLKKLHLLIMTSSAYQRDSKFGPAENLAVDADSRYLWRFHRRRLEGEAVWDSIHAVAGTLQLQMGGPPVFPQLTEEELANMRERYRWVASADPAQHARRGLYIVNYRNFKFPLFEVFDAPTNAVSSPGRDVSTVATQALWLLNHPVAWKQARHLAARVVKESGTDPAAWVQSVWRITLGRLPTAEEQSEALALLQELTNQAGPTIDQSEHAELQGLSPQQAGGLVQLCLGMFNHNEFLFID